MNGVVDLEEVESLVSDRILAIVNPATTEPVVRSTFNVVDESMSEDPREHPLPAAGLLFKEERWEDDEVLGGGVSKQGRVHFAILLLTQAPKYGGGMRGPRGAYRGSKLIADDITDWEIYPGCLVEVHTRTPYVPRNENDEMVPMAGMLIDASFEAAPLTK